MLWLGLLGGLVLSDPAVAQNKIRSQLDQLVVLNSGLAATCSPTQGLRELESVCASLLVVLYGLEQGHLTDQEVRTAIGPEKLAYLAPFWLPFAIHYVDLSAYRGQLEMLGLDETTWGTQARQDVYRFLALLRLLHADQTGHHQLDQGIHQRYLTIAERGKGMLLRLKATHAGDLTDQQEPCGRWILERANPGWYASLHRRVREDASTFVILRDEDVPRPGNSNLPATAFRDLALAGPAQYAEKWFWHDILLDEMFERTRTGTNVDVANGVNLYIPSYVLLCHAGIPISVFQPRPTAKENTIAFTAGYEEDVPHQMLFSTSSHLSQASALRYELGQSGVDTFNPIQHMVCFPFLAVSNTDGTELNQALPVAGGYMGYLDAFAKDAVPDTFQLGLTDQGSL